MLAASLLFTMLVALPTTGSGQSILTRLAAFRACHVLDEQGRTMNRAPLH